MYLTEQEMLKRQGEQLFGIQKILQNSDVSLDDITALIPGLVHLNKIHTLDLVYLDKQHREILEVDMEDLIKNGRQILMNVAKPESYQQAKRLFSKMDFKDPSLVVSHFQALRGFPEKNRYQWYYSVKKRFNDELILTVTNPVQSFGAMHKQLEKLIKEDLFISANQQKIDSLSPREKEIMKLISQGYNSSQVAERLFISTHTVSTHRKNIWRKLEIKTYAELIRYAEHFDLL